MTRIELIAAKGLICLGILLGAGVFAGPAVAAICPLKADAKALTGTGAAHDVSVVPHNGNVKIGAPFSVIMTVCAKDGAPFAGSLKPDAIMPMHKHGMNYRPSVAKLGEGLFRVDGFVFHMPGHWQFVFELTDGDSRDRVRIDHHVK